MVLMLVIVVLVVVVLGVCGGMVPAFVTKRGVVIPALVRVEGALVVTGFPAGSVVRPASVIVVFSAPLIRNNAVNTKHC